MTVDDKKKDIIYEDLIYVLINIMDFFRVLYYDIYNSEL